LCCSFKDGDVDAVSLWRSPKHDPPDGRATLLLECLIPHIRTALQLRKRLTATDAVRIFSEASLDAMSIGAFLVNSKGKVQHMNRLASTHLEGGACLRFDKGRLTTNAPEAPSGRLEQLIAQATSIETLDYGLAGSMRVSHFNVTVVPVPQQNQILRHDLYALVFVTDTRQPAKSRAAAMRQLYGLTPSEARVADRLLDGLEVREIADRLGITFETCRFHLKRIFSKTSTRRQAELIRLMLSLPGQ
jgi:DNA-binding CsgD family transcriptional regulator